MFWSRQCVPGETPRGIPFPGSKGGCRNEPPGLGAPTGCSLRGDPFAVAQRSKALARGCRTGKDRKVSAFPQRKPSVVEPVSWFLGMQVGSWPMVKRRMKPLGDTWCRRPVALRCEAVPISPFRGHASTSGLSQSRSVLSVPSVIQGNSRAWGFEVGFSHVHDR